MLVDSCQRNIHNAAADPESTAIAFQMIPAITIRACCCKQVAVIPGKQMYIGAIMFEYLYMYHLEHILYKDG